MHKLFYILFFLISLFIGQHLLAFEEYESQAVKAQKYANEVFKKTYGDQDLEKITCINLKGKGLKKCPSQIIECQNLEELNLSDNLFLEIDPNIFNLTHLRMLSLEGTNIKNLPLKMKQCTTLEKITLSEDPHLNTFIITFFPEKAWMEKFCFI